MSRAHLFRKNTTGAARSREQPLDRWSMVLPNPMSQVSAMSVDSSWPREAARPVVLALLPIIGVVFIAFLVIGLALPVLPLHVHQGLGLGAFVVGLVAGAQFATSLLSRFWAGHFADSRGAKRATVTGLLVAAVAGLLYLLSLGFVRQPGTSVTILLLGRAVLGGAESCIVTGCLHLGVGTRRATKHGPDHGLGRDGDVRRLRDRRSSWHRPLPGYGFAAIEVAAGLDLVIVEGVGASRTEVMPWIDCALWVQSDLEEAERRGIARDGGTEGGEGLLARVGRPGVRFPATATTLGTSHGHRERYSNAALRPEH